MLLLLLALTVATVSAQLGPNYPPPPPPYQRPLLPNGPYPPPPPYSPPYQPGYPGGPGPLLPNNNDDSYGPSAPYAYEYGVNDNQYGTNFNAQESSDGNGDVSGSYSVALPDGRIQTVNYRADAVNGFVADVKYSDAPPAPYGSGLPASYGSGLPAPYGSGHLGPVGPLPPPPGAYNRPGQYQPVTPLNGPYVPPPPLRSGLGPYLPGQDPYGNGPAGPYSPPRQGPLGPFRPVGPGPVLRPGGLPPLPISSYDV